MAPLAPIVIELPHQLWISSILEIIAGTISVFISSIAALQAYRARKHAEKDTQLTTQVSNQVSSLEININHRLSELIAEAKTAAEAKGIAQGIAQEQSRQAVKESGILQEKSKEDK